MTVLQSDIGGTRVQQGENGIEATRVFMVEATNANANARQLDALFDPGVPVYGAVHPDARASRSFVRRKYIEEIADSRTQFRVVCEYRELAGQELADEKTAAAGTILDLTTTTRFGEIVEHTDKDDNPIQDSGGIQRSIRRERTEVVLMFSRVETGINVAQQIFWSNTVNELVWNSYAVRTWRIFAVHQQRIQGRTDGAIRANYELVYNSKTWDGIHVITLNGTAFSINYQAYVTRDFTPLGVVFT